MWGTELGNLIRRIREVKSKPKNKTKNKIHTFLPIMTTTSYLGTCGSFKTFLPEPPLGRETQNRGFLLKSVSQNALSALRLGPGLPLERGLFLSLTVLVWK